MGLAGHTKYVLLYMHVWDMACVLESYEMGGYCIIIMDIGVVEVHIQSNLDYPNPFGHLRKRCRSDKQ